MTHQPFSGSGFLKTYALPALVLLLIPGVGVWFAGHATRTMESELHRAVVKGIERGSHLRMTDVIADAGGFDRRRIAALSGPNLAIEIARIGGEILARRELCRVDEDRDDHAACLPVGKCDQRKMAPVQRSHGRHQRDLATGLAQARERPPEGGKCAHDVWLPGH